MCFCLAGSTICEVCGVSIAYQEFSQGVQLGHLVEHQVDLNGLHRALWEPHVKQACLEARRRHWASLVRVGIVAAR